MKSMKSTPEKEEKMKEWLDKLLGFLNQVHFRQSNVGSHF